MPFNKVVRVVLLLLLAFGLAGGAMISVGLNQQEIDLEKGLVAYWSFDEGEGDIIFDESGNNDVGLPMCAGEGCSRPKWVEGKLGFALEFDGEDDYVDCGANASLNIGDEITIAAWIKGGIQGGGGYKGLIVKSSLVYGFWTEASSAKKVRGGVKIGGAPYFMTAATDVLDNLWHLIKRLHTPQLAGGLTLCWGSRGAQHSPGQGRGLCPAPRRRAVRSEQCERRELTTITFDGSNGRFFIDDIEDVNSPLAAGGSIDSSPTESVWIGRQSTAHFNGLIDEVRIYNRVLTEEGIRELYEQGEVE